MSLQERLRDEQISAKAYEHPADRAATAALRSIPLMDKAVKLLSDLGIERLVRQLLVGQAVEVSDKQIPQLWARHVRAASVLDIDRVPELFVTQTPFVNAATFGAKRPMVIVLSGLVRDYTGSEVDVVLAHEMGHVLSEHYYYRTALFVLQEIIRNTTGVGTFLPGIPVRAIYLVLLEWWRTAELSADRASALVAGDPLSTCQMLMRLAGGALEGMSLDAFLAQAARYEDEEDVYARWARSWYVAERAAHPFPVKRARELMSWVSDGSYDRVRGGVYVRRGQEPPVTREFDAAVEHYQERFLKILGVAAGGAERFLGQLEEWLRGQQPPSGKEAGGNGPGAGSGGRGGTKGRRT